MTRLKSPPISRVSAAWLAASVLTVVTVVLAHAQHQLRSSTAEVIAVVVIGAAKTALVLADFMEIRTAPPWLRRYATAWVIGLWGALLVIYLW